MAPEDLDLGSYASPEVQKCPIPFVQTLLEQAPVYRDPGTGMYMVTRYDDIAHVNSHPETFSNRTTVVINRQTSVTDEVARRYRERGWPEEHALAFADPPQHTWHRALVDKVFSPSYVKRLEPYTLRIIDDLIDGFIEDGKSEIARGFAIHLPMYVLSDQLGVPREHYDRFRIWSVAWVARNDPHCPPELELEYTDLIIDMQNYLAARAKEYEVAPCDKLLSRLVNAEVDGARLGMGEMLMIAGTILTAGNETTTTGIGTALYLILRDPALKARVIANPALIPAVIEEMLRTHPPVPHLYRVATCETEIGGVTVPEGATIQVSYLGGNYDPAKWSCPAEFDIDRAGARNHLAFGRGIHFCVGNQLARMEMRMAIARLLERLPDLRLSERHPEPEFEANFQIHGLTDLHVEFTPGKRIN